MRIAIECAGLAPGEAGMLRKSMATFRFTGGVSAFRDRLEVWSTGADRDSFGACIALGWRNTGDAD